MLTWTPALAVGVPELDAQHQELFRRANEFLDGLGGHGPVDLERLLGFLRAYAEAHFGVEEGWMREGLYPGLAAHEAEHRRFLAELDGLAGSEGQARPPLEVASWLVRWLHDHVLLADGAAARFIRATARPPPGGRCH